MITAADIPGIAGLVLISASDDAAEAQAEYKTPAARNALTQGEASDCQSPLSGCTFQSLQLEALDHAASWSFTAVAPRLSRLPKLPILMITSNDPYAPENDALAAAIVAHRGMPPTQIHFQTDHAYVDHRAELASAVIDWLQKH